MTETEFAVIPLIPAKRCSDYDSECVDVPNPFICWTGCHGTLPQADGYCPLLVGQEQKP